MNNPYQYAFRENAKGVFTHNVYVSKGDKLEKYRQHISDNKLVQS